MNRKQLGKSDIYVSELTLGCMSLGTDKRTAKNIIDTALEKGINHLDTADLYDFGLNEEIIGELIKDKRQEIVITTKAGNHFSKEKKGWFWDPSKEYLLNAVKNSLKRLQTDYIDFFMLHGGTIDDPIDETIEAMEMMKQEGLIRAYGISSIRPNVIKSYVEKSEIDGVMLQYSLLDRRPEEEILDLLHKHQISAIARGPLAKGILSAYDREYVKKKAKNGFLDYEQNELVTLLNELKTIAGEKSLNELAIKYILKHPAVTTVTFGASSEDQVADNTDIDLSNPLPDSLYEQLKEHTKNQIYMNIALNHPAFRIRREKLKTLIIAHRGASKYAPENTMPAFELAYKMKADGIETDVQLTKDGIPVLIHDSDVRRTTNGFGLVKDYHLKELKKLDAGMFFSKNYTKTPIVTLNEFLSWARDKSLYLNLELKNNKIAYKNLEEKVLDAIETFRVKEQTILSSFNARSIQKLRRLDQTVDLALLHSRRHEDLISYVQDLGASSLHVRKRLINKKLLSQAREHQIPVRIYTVNRSVQLYQLMRKEVAGIITDVPDRAFAIRKLVE